MLELPPHHLIHDTGVTLDDLHDLRGDILVHIVRHRCTMVACGVHRHGGLDCLQQAAGVDTGDEEAGLVQGLRTESIFFIPNNS